MSEEDERQLEDAVENLTILAVKISNHAQNRDEFKTRVVDYLHYFHRRGKTHYLEVR